MRALTIEKLSLEGFTEPFDFEIFFGDRVAVLGKNGTGESHFLRINSGDPTVKYSGTFKLGARVNVGYFAQTHSHPEFMNRTLLELSDSTMLLLDEPTDNLDLASAESLEHALGRFEGTVILVTHDLWFARGFTRFLYFRDSGFVIEISEPVFGEERAPESRSRSATAW